MEKLREILNLDKTCGYITFINTGVPDFGCDEYEDNVQLKRVKRKQQLAVKNNDKELKSILVSLHGIILIAQFKAIESFEFLLQSRSRKMIPEILSPANASDITSFHIAEKGLPKSEELTPKRYPDNVYRSADCDEILEKELAELQENNDDRSVGENYPLVSQSSIEIDVSDESSHGTQKVDEVLGEVNMKKISPLLAETEILPFLFTGMDNFRRSFRHSIVRCRL